METSLHPTALRILEAVSSSLDEAGFCDLSNAAIAEKASLKLDIVRFWVRSLVADGQLFAHGKGKARKLSLVSNPATDRGIGAIRFVLHVDDVSCGGQYEFERSQKRIGADLKVSVPLVKEFAEEAISVGWVERTETFKRGENGSKRTIHTYRITEKGFAEVIAPRDEKAKKRGMMRPSESVLVDGRELEALRAGEEELAGLKSMVAALQAQLDEMASMASKLQAAQAGAGHCKSCIDLRKEKVQLEAEFAEFKKTALAPEEASALRKAQAEAFQDSEKQWLRIQALESDRAEGRERESALSRSNNRNLSQKIALLGVVRRIPGLDREWFEREYLDGLSASEKQGAAEMLAQFFHDEEMKIAV